MVPLVVMCVGAAQHVHARNSDVRRAEGVVEVLDRVVRLAELRSALFSEWLAAEILVPARNPAPDILGLSEFGRTLLDDPDQLTRRTDQALAAVAADDRPFEQPEIDRVRADRASWGDSISGISVALGPFYDDTEATMLRLAAPVRTSIVVIADPALVAAGATFERAIELPGAAAELLRTVTDLFLAEPGRRPLLQSQTAAAHAAFDQVSGRFARSLAAPGSEAQQLGPRAPQLPDELTAVLADARTGALTEPNRAPAEPTAAGLTLLAGIDWLVEVDSIPSEALVHVRDAAGRVVGEARDAQQRWGVIVASVIVASLVVIVALARSIDTPVRRLTEQARRLGAGDLDVQPLPTTGPPDVAVAARAMNDVVANLALIMKKAKALTDGRLSDPALDEPLPGPLGAELETSTASFIRTLIERQSFRARLDHEATHDALTGLANRSAVLAALHEAPPEGPSRVAAVVYIDVNDFKRVNDVHGHAGGDHLLQIVAARIAACAADTDLVARWAGDEFVVVLADRTPAAAHRLATAMVESVSRPVLLDGSLTRVSACAGVAAAPDPTDRGTGWAEDLLRQADLAAYHAKASGAGSVVLFDEQLGEKVRSQKETESALAAALAASADELYLVYQPIVDGRTGRLRGIETLIRWNHPVRGPMRPDDFVPIAERSDLIVQLDQWVVTHALRQYARWHTELGLDAVTISVNVSARTLNDADVVDRVMAILSECAVTPHRLMLEVTETTLITDIEQASEVLRRLRERGVSIAIDDFGTGFTSISQLRHLPVDELKIDQSFVAGLLGSADHVLVRMIVDLAHHLGIPTVAEGVESAAERDLLIELGCDAMQGFLFSPPMEADAFAAFALAQAAARPS